MSKNKTATALAGRQAAPATDFRAVFEASMRPLLLIAADAPRYTMLAANSAHARAFATTPEQLEGWGVLEVFGPRPEPAVAEFAEAVRTSLDKVSRTRAPDQMAARAYAVQGAGGESKERYWSALNSPILDAAGRVTHIVSAVQDVTGEVLERRSEEARRLLMREVDHRARNALTVVQSFIRLTTAETLEEFRQVLEGRVEALARAQTSLAARRWEGGSLQEVVEAELASISQPERYQLSGAPVLLPAEQVQAISMILHELATNASKYGALSNEAGALNVSWTRDGGTLQLIWSESGGPTVSAPTRQGFGSKLIGQLTRQLDGDIAFEWRPCGLEVRLGLNLPGAAT